MDLYKIPNTEIVVSPLCLGTMLFGNPTSRDDAIRLVHWALDNGINFIDTADMYEGYDRYAGSPGGVSETIIGEALRLSPSDHHDNQFRQDAQRFSCNLVAIRVDRRA